MAILLALTAGQRCNDNSLVVRATVINKFRGDLTLLTPGLACLEERTGVPVAGVVPYYHDIFIPEEDGVSLERRTYLKSQMDYLLDIAVIGFPHISNFDDFDPLAMEEGVRLRYVEDGDELGNPDMVILPGTKSTVSDLEWLRRMGFDAGISDLSGRGIPVIGICGGYQMLGVSIRDPEGIESSVDQAEGPGPAASDHGLRERQGDPQGQGRSGRGRRDFGGCSGAARRGVRDTHGQVPL